MARKPSVPRHCPQDHLKTDTGRQDPGRAGVVFSLEETDWMVNVFRARDASLSAAGQTNCALLQCCPLQSFKGRDAKENAVS